MGVVYKAQDLQLDRFVALKFLPPDLTRDEESKERFIHEAKAASALDHNNICTIYEIGKTEEDQLFIAMAYYDGETLKKKIERGPLKIDEAIDITIQVAGGLLRAHEEKIIHRDIKPANIFFTVRDEVKILDFGLAKVTGQTQLTKMGSTVGTVAYMSPEQTRGEKVDRRTDIWSLGVMLYEMITGQLPFKGDYEQAVTYSILNEAQEPITGLRSGVPMELERIVNKALIKKPDERYQHVDEMMVDLKAIVKTIEKPEPQTSSISEANILTTPTQPEKITSSRKRWLFGVAAALIVVASMVVYFIGGDSSEVTEIERKMLVVLPFKNLGLPEDEYFADGITEEITSRLSEIKQIGVIGRTSADQYKNTEKSIDQIGEELGVNYLLEGSVRWEKIPDSESRIRVTPQLIKVSDGTHLWTERYDAILASVFDLQTDIAEKVADALNITLLGAEQESISQKPTDNLEAYDYYLRGNLYYKQGTAKESISVAEQMFLKAVELDSNFVLAYIRLAEINMDFYWFYWDRTDDRIRKSKYYIDKALEINPDLPEIYLALGHYYYHGFLDYDRALNELEAGLKIKPNDEELLSYVGFVKRRQGKFEEAISYMKKSLKLDPLNDDLNLNIGETFLLIKNYEMAEKYIDKAISTIPDWGAGYVSKAKVHILRDGNIEGALEILSNSLGVVNRRKWGVISLLAQVQIFDGKYEEALKTLSGASSDVFENQWAFLPKAQLFATIYGLQKNNNLEKAYYDSAKVLIDSKLKERPDDANLYSARGIALAGLGKKEEAIKEGKLAVELLPVTKEAWRGFHRELDLARIYTMVG